jgi:hypothetical protein
MTVTAAKRKEWLALSRCAKSPFWQLIARTVWFADFIEVWTTPRMLRRLKRKRLAQLNARSTKFLTPHTIL